MTIPRRAVSSGSAFSIRWPSNSTEPRVISPRSSRISPDSAFRVVVLPAPFAPISAVMPPLETLNDTPFSTRIVPQKTTSMLLRVSIGGAGGSAW